MKIEYGQGRIQIFWSIIQGKFLLGNPENLKRSGYKVDWYYESKTALSGAGDLEKDIDLIEVNSFKKNDFGNFFVTEKSKNLKGIRFFVEYDYKNSNIDEYGKVFVLKEFNVVVYNIKDFQNDEILHHFDFSFEKNTFDEEKSREIRFKNEYWFTLFLSEKLNFQEIGFLKSLIKPECFEKNQDRLAHFLDCEKEGNKKDYFKKYSLFLESKRTFHLLENGFVVEVDDNGFDYKGCDITPCENCEIGLKITKNKGYIFKTIELYNTKTFTFIQKSFKENYEIFLNFENWSKEGLRNLDEKIEKIERIEKL